MTRFVFVLFLFFVFVSCETTSQQSAEPTRPNIILIMADDLGFETLGSNGSTDYQTPELDKITSQGMRFTHAYAQPLCTPTRVQLMTGKYNFRNYVGFGILDPEEVTFGNLLKESGYATCIVGKWQLYGNKRQRELFQRTGSLPGPTGFDESCLWQVKERYGGRFKDPYLEINGDSVQHFKGKYGPDMFVEFAQDFIHRKKDQPFFIYYPMALTHDPFQPSPDHPDYASYQSGTKLNDSTYFRDNLTYMDKLIGQLNKSLEKEGIAENTLLLFIGDNGTDRDVVSSFDGKRIRGNKGYSTDAGTHVPMIASWPGTIKPNQVNDQLIDLTDFIPTIMEAAETPIPETFLADGLSFYSSLIGEKAEVRDWVFCHYAPQWGKFKDVRFVHNGEWKLYEDGRIFHISNDLEEEIPIDSSTLTESTKEIIAEFETVLAKMN